MFVKFASGAVLLALLGSPLAARSQNILQDSQHEVISPSNSSVSGHRGIGITEPRSTPDDSQPSPHVIVTPQSGSTPDDSPQLPHVIVTPQSGSTPNNSPQLPGMVATPQSVAEEAFRNIGEIKEIEGCNLSLFGGALRFKGRQEDQCKWELPKTLEDQGWVIIGSRVNVNSRVGKDHRSGYGTSFTGSNSVFSYVYSTLDKLQQEISVALSKGDTKLAADLKVKYEAVRTSSLESSSTHNTAILKIWTQSGVFTRAGINATMIVRLMKVR